MLTALVAVVPAAVKAASTLTVTSVDRSDSGAIRIVVRYEGGQQPSFRVTPTCSRTAPGEWGVAATVSVVPARKRAVLDLRDGLAWLTDRRHPCQARGLSVQMLDGNHVVASTEVPIELAVPRALDAAPPPPPDRTMPRVGLVGGRLRAPQTKMSEAGIAFAFSGRVTFNLSYERTAYAPLMHHDHDDGILTGVKIGF